MIKTVEKYPVISLTIIVLFMLLPHLDVASITIMEARNFITSREIIQDNHWLLTTMNGEPRYQKPPLPTWLTAVSGLLFGTNNVWALRLPAALMVLFSGYFIYFLSLKLTLPKTHSFRNSLIFVTSFYVVGIIIEAPWDIFAHGFMLASIYFLFRFFRQDINLWKNALIAAVFFALSFLSKGPVSLFALFLPFIISYGIVYKFKNFKNKIVPFTSFIILSLILGSWWFLYVRYADPEAFLAIATKETGNWSSYNVKPFYYYWSFFIQSGLWTIPAFIGLLYPYILKRVMNKKAYKFTFWWTIIAVILLSLVPEKKSRYLMPVLIPLALNTGFYIQYLIQYFSKITAKKETIPVYFNFGLIALVGIAIPAVLFIILKDKISQYLVSYILTSASLLIVGILIFKNLYHKKFKNIFYLTIFFVVAIFVFGMPISNIFNKNDHYTSLKSIHQLEEKFNIKTYAFEEVAPEMIWDYNGKIKTFYNNDFIETLNENKFGLLLTNDNFDKINKQLAKNYTTELITNYNLNVGSKQKERLIRQFYIVSKK